MTKMAAMPIYGKTLRIFSRTERHVIFGSLYNQSDRKEIYFDSAKELISREAYQLQVCHLKYREVPKFPDARKLFCNHSKIQTKWPNQRVFAQNMQMEWQIVKTLI